MTLKEFYETAGGSYEEAMSRLMDEKRILKYLGKFADTIDYAEMNKAIDEERWEEAFRFSHNLKGMALNLSLGRLAQKSSELCETMRHGKPEVDISDLRVIVDREYADLMSIIRTVE